MNRCVTHWHFYKFTREAIAGRLRTYNSGLRCPSPAGISDKSIAPPGHVGAKQSPNAGVDSFTLRGVFLDAGSIAAAGLAACKSLFVQV